MFGLIFAYFIDNTEILFQALRRLNMDVKYNKDDFLFKHLDNLPKNQLINIEYKFEKK
jgi:hypothetical protein